MLVQRKIVLLIGHILILLGCYLLTWGLYLLPVSDPTPSDIVTKPLFGGLVCILGGICAMRHAYCKCVQEMFKK